jgi:4-amino-4-deoxy-L-arabinose transferase-like glycosyltransferase
LRAPSDNGARFSATVNRACIVILIAAMIAGVGLRVVRLDLSPPGFMQDEACDGYDAYCLVKTGRDQHGHFLPLTMQAFNDYRMPLFDYSLVPFVAAFGLKPVSVRLCAAMWGIADLAAIAIIAGLTLGWPGAAISALLIAFSPWHLHFSRFGIEGTAASATVDLAMASFFLWLSGRKNRWLLVSGFFFGLSLYSYSITKAFVPLMIGWLALFYWRDLMRSARIAVAAISLVILFALPQAVMLLQRTADMQARFNQISVFNSDASMLDSGDSMLDRFNLFRSGLASYFSPSYLFVNGDDTLVLHPPGFGELLPEQAPLIALGLFALLGVRRRKLALLLLGWITMAALPAAMLIPSPHSLHDFLAFAPWTLLSALGFVVLLESALPYPLLKLATAAVLVVATIVSGVQFVRFYFRDYPGLARLEFRYGLDQVVRQIEQYGDDRQRVFLTELNQGYIYVLFFRAYPPELFQRTPVTREEGLFGKVLGFDRYLFPVFNPQSIYESVEHGVFVLGEGDTPPLPPAATIRYPDGAPAYYIVVK